MNIGETMDTIIRLAKAGLTLELQEKIVELRKHVMDLDEKHLKLRSKNLELQKELERYTKGDICPKCKKPTWALESSTAKPGVKILRVYKCSQCGFSEQYLQSALIE